jgi:hypothetical protein
MENTMNDINKLTARGKSALLALLTSPAAEAALAEVDQQQLQNRRDLVKQITGLPTKHEAKASAAAIEADKATAARAAAQKALEAAFSAEMEARAVASSLSSIYSSEREFIKRQLEATADPRLQRFADRCWDLFGIARNRDPNLVATSSLHHGGKVVPDFTIGNAACAALMTARALALDLRYEPLTRDEVTAAIARMQHDLRLPLQSVGLTMEPGPGQPDEFSAVAPLVLQ